MRSVERALRNMREPRVAGSRSRGAASRLDRLVRRIDGLPARFGCYASAAFLGATIAYGAAAGGHLGDIGGSVMKGVGYVAASAGFEVDRVLISGHEETAERDIVAALELDETTSLLTFDPFAARERLSALPWVKSVTVQKLFPNTLKLEITEREAFALWQIGGMVSLIGRTGESIGMLSDERFADLPMVVGYGANRAAAELLEMVEPHPRIAARLRAAVRVADRRWNLLFDNGVELRLPEEDAAGALSDIARLDREDELMSRDIVLVDMRLADRIVVRLSEEAAVQREARLESGGSAKRKGADI